MWDPHDRHCHCHSSILRLIGISNSYSFRFITAGSAAYREPSSKVSGFTQEVDACTSSSWVQYQATNIILYNIYFSPTVQSEKTPEPTKKPTNSDRSPSSSISSKVSGCAQKGTALYGWVLQYNTKELNAYPPLTSQSTKKPTKKPTNRTPSSSSTSSSKVSGCAQKDTALYGWALQYNIKELNACCIYIYFHRRLTEHKETDEEAHPQGENRYIRPCSFLSFGSEDIWWTS